MDLKIIIVSEENQIERDKYHMISLICGIFFKKAQTNLLQNRNRLTDLEKKLMIMEAGAGVGVGID